MPYAVDESGSPIFFVSSLAMHTQNMRANPQVSLFVFDRSSSGDAQGSARLTLVGSVAQVATAEVSEIYMTKHEGARQWQSFGDFSYLRLTVSSAYFIAGFGLMGWIAAEEYRSAWPAI